MTPFNWAWWKRDAKVTANKPREGHFKNAGAAPCRILREFPIASDDESKSRATPSKFRCFEVDRYGARAGA